LASQIAINGEAIRGDAVTRLGVLSAEFFALRSLGLGLACSKKCPVQIGAQIFTPDLAVRLSFYAHAQALAEFLLGAERLAEVSELRAATDRESNLLRDAAFIEVGPELFHAQ